MQDEIRVPLVMRQADGALAQVLTAATGKAITYYQEYAGAWRLVWQYVNWTAEEAAALGPAPLATPLEFVVRDRKAAAYLGYILNIYAAPGGGAYLRESDRPAARGRIMLADVLPTLRENAAPLLAAHPEWAAGPVRKATRKAPEGWQAADYQIATDLGPVTVKHGFTRGRFGAVGDENPERWSRAQIILTYLPAGLAVEYVYTFAEAAAFADAYGAVLPADLPFGAPPPATLKEPVAAAREQVNRALGYARRS
jgi:hypothetical protein